MTDFESQCRDATAVRDIMGIILHEASERRVDQQHENG